MKYHIDTIPIWDAYKKDSECPLCLIHEGSEESYVDQYLGGSVMEPAARVMTNQVGFCRHHLGRLYGAKTRHPLALMLHTHLKEVQAGLDKHADGLAKGLEATAASPPLSRAASALSGKNPPADRLSKHLHQQQAGCAICRDLERNMLRYAQTIGHMWHSDKEFNALFEQSRGFCQGHFALMLDANRKSLPLTARNPFLAAITRLQRENMARMEEELAWYIEKMDYNKRDLPWKTSRDALTRAMTKLRGGIYSD